MRIISFSPFGYEGSLVSVEVDLRRGIPAVDVVGLADGAVKEARERMRSAICNAGFEFPPERVLISLSPADLKKEGAGFDLAIALAVLQAKKNLEKESDKDLEEESVLVMGELELCGNVRAVRGIHAAAATALAAGIKKCIVPQANFSEAQEVNGVKVFAAENLRQAFLALDDSSLFVDVTSDIEQSKNQLLTAVNVDGILFPKVTAGFQFSEIAGQRLLVRGLQIAAAGGHNLLAFGPPGCGKTMACQKFPGLLPLLTREESGPVTRIHSLAGILPTGVSGIQIPPFRMPHQTASIEGICGGGPSCKPGEISLAHNGVLFLDEAAEFRTSVLQMLRVPLESGRITISRAGRSSMYPASFQLLMATNPCPCGNFGTKNKICLCSTRSIEMYWKRFSGPLLDRVDMRVPVEIPQTEERFSTESLRVEIAKAVKNQRKRQNKKNRHLNASEIELFCAIDNDVKKILEDASIRYGFSPRAIASCLKVARTIADMDDSENILSSHLEEAIVYRKNSGGMNFLGSA